MLLRLCTICCSRVHTYVYLRVYENAYNVIISPAVGKIVPFPFFHNCGFDIKLPQKVDVPLNKEPEPIQKKMTRNKQTMNFFVKLRKL